jgi:hypothetical protein
MDYKRIYEHFIQSRRQTELALIESGEYVERHHILPISLGGEKKEPANLITLTAEDHLFAHLLLAQIYGGTMWMAVKAMLDFEPNQTASYRQITNRRSRKQYAFVRKQVAQFYSDNYSGQNNANADQSEYTFEHINGGECTGTRTDIADETGLSRGVISALILGNKPTALGWYYPPTNPEGRFGPLAGEDSPHADKTIYTFYHLSGKTFTGTRAAFQKKIGYNPRLLATGLAESTQDGWAMSPDKCSAWLDSIQDRAQHAADSRGDISGLNNPRADQTIIEFVHPESKETKHMTRVEMTNFLGTTTAQMQGMLEGHYRLDGWTTKEFEHKQKTHLWANRGAKLVLEKDGQQLTGPRTELAKKLGVAVGTVSAFAQGRYKTCKGWVLVRQIDD